MRMIMLGISTACFGLALPHPAYSQHRLSLYCSNLEEQCRLIANAFQRKTGLTVAMIRKSSGEFYAQIKAEQSQPNGDVWWGGPSEIHDQAASDGLLEPYASKMLSELSPWFQKKAEQTGHRTTGIYLGAIGIGVNTEQLARKKLPAPKCWSDLIDSRYKGEIQLADPWSSGTAYTFVASTLERMGEQQGFEYLKKLHANVNQYTKSGSAPAKALALGETGIAIAFLHGMTPKMLSGAPVQTFVPCEGTGFEIIGVSLIKGAKNADGARQFVDFALSAEAQSLNAELGIAATPSNPAATKADGTFSIDELNIPESSSPSASQPDERRRILEKFDRTVRNEK